MKREKGWYFPDADQFMVSELREDGTYQAANLLKALAFVTDWSLAIDGGAHIGTWSRLMAPRFQRVIAVEPSPDTYEALCANLYAFGCDNVDPRHIAIGSVPGQVSMTLDQKGASMANTGARFVQAGGTIPVERIDDWNLPSLGFLKLDIEGSEVDALEGARKTLRHCKPVVLFENKNLWRRFNHPKDAPQQLLKHLGFRQVALVSRDEIWAHP